MTTFRIILILILILYLISRLAISIVIRESFILKLVCLLMKNYSASGKESLLETLSGLETLTSQGFPVKYDVTGNNDLLKELYLCIRDSNEETVQSNVYEIVNKYKEKGY